MSKNLYYKIPHEDCMECGQPHECAHCGHIKADQAIPVGRREDNYVFLLQIHPKLGILNLQDWYTFMGNNPTGSLYYNGEPVNNPGIFLDTVIFADRNNKNRAFANQPEDNSYDMTAEEFT